MPETISKTEYFYSIVEDKPGEGRRLLEFCSAHGVNLINFTAFPFGEKLAKLVFIPEDAGKLKLAAAEAGVELIGPRPAFLIQGTERIGVLVEYHLRLADAGINVRAGNGTSDGRGGFGYILWVNPDDFDRAANVLGI
jgi:hypothetical protein